jgi:hypothetical protein
MPCTVGYRDLHVRCTSRRTDLHTGRLQILKRELGQVRLVALDGLVLRDFIDKRVAAGAGGVKNAADLSFLSAVLKWGRHARRLDIRDKLALEASTWTCDAVADADATRR